MFLALTFHRPDSPLLPPLEVRAREIALDPSASNPMRIAFGYWFVVECALRGEIARSEAAVRTIAPIARAADAAPLATRAAGSTPLRSSRCSRRGAPASRGATSRRRGRPRYAPFGSTEGRSSRVATSRGSSPRETGSAAGFRRNLVDLGRFGDGAESAGDMLARAAVADPALAEAARS